MAYSRLTALLILVFMVLAPYSSTISTVPFVGIDVGEEKVSCNLQTGKNYMLWISVDNNGMGGGVGSNRFLIG